MPQRKLVYAYFLLVGCPLLGVFCVLNAGRGLSTPSVQTIAATVAATAPQVTEFLLPRLVLQILVILAVSKAVSWLFRAIRQPQVIGEMAAGIALGPSLLGWLAPGLSHSLFPPASLSYLNAFSQIGLVLFIFLVGLSLNAKELREYGHSAVLTSHVSIAVPFVLGTVTALYFYPRLSSAHVGFTGFALFMGAAMSITAFPVLARILAERNLLRTKLGNLVIACAAVDDVTGWCVLAGIVVLVQSSHASLPIWLQLSGVCVYVLVMMFVVRRAASYFERSFTAHGRLTDSASTSLMLLILASGLITELLGIHLLFGAFLLGVVMPKSTEFTNYIRHRFEAVTISLLLPLFFAYTGLRTSLGSIAGNGVWLYTLVALVVAIAGKLGGCVAAGKLTGMPWRDATALGVLMNTRGLMELVILNIGLDIGVISPTVFSMMVTVALVTSFMTTPLLDVVYRGPQLEEAEFAPGRVA